MEYIYTNYSVNIPKQSSIYKIGAKLVSQRETTSSVSGGSGGSLAVLGGCVLLSVQAQEVSVRKYDAAAQEPLVQTREIKPLPERPMVGEQPFGFALMPKVETPNESWDVVLLRFNLFVGRHRCVYGLDLGVLGGITDQEMGGLEISGLYNRVGTSDGALQIAGIFSEKRDFF